MGPPSGAITSTRRSWSSKVSSWISAIVDALCDRAVCTETAADEIEGSGYVVGQRLFRAGLVASFQRRDQRPMVIHRQGVAALVMDTSCETHIGAGLKPQAFDNWNQYSRPRCVVDVEMEGVVE